MASIYQVTRRTSGDAGPPASLRSGQMFYNMVDGKLYIGFGDNGSGIATSIKVFAEDDHVGNLPSGGTNGKILGYTGGVPAWVDAPEGAIYTASGNGIELTGSEFGLNYTEIATGLNLAATYAPIVHTHDAADITSGVLDIARIPVLPSSVQIVSSGTIANLTAPQQAEIGDGSIVTTTDGRRWVYSGTGSKTAEASYVELADVTPEWSVIANKPSFATVATTGAYADLTGKPTLGTMAAQNADSVAITGGTIDNVILDGGTL